jgi:predicted transcriptional regulator
MEDTRPEPSPQELELLRILWKEDNSTARNIYKRLSKKKKLTRGTITRQLHSLVNKGWVTVNDEEFPNTYHAVVPQQKLTSRLLNVFVGHVFGGSMKAMLQHLLTEKGTPEEKKAIRRRLERFDREGK